MTTKQKYLTIIGCCICYIGTIYLPAVVKQLIQVDSVNVKFMRYAFLHLSLAAGMLYYVKNVEKRSWASIGFKKFDGGRDVKWGLIGFGLGGMTFAITGPLVVMLGMDSTVDGVMKLMVFPIWVRVGIAVIAGITEEILFRTYPIERLTEWTGSIWIAALIALLLFTGLHIPFWSLGGGIQIGIGTLVWTLIYIKTRSIWAMMIMHVVNDLFAFIMLPYLFST